MVKPNMLEKTFDGKKYKFAVRFRTKKMINAHKNHLEQYAITIGAKISFRTLKIKENGKTWYYLYRRYKR